MTALNGGIPSDEVKNYFNSIQTPFPVLVDGKIDTVQFLEASKGVVSLIDQFGSVFGPVKYDMNGNIEKITQVYNMNQEAHKSLNDIVLTEQTSGDILATDALLWLRRALHLILRFFELVLEDDGSTEDLARFLKAAYRETLNTYHSWHLQILFSMLCRMCPGRSRLLQVMTLNRGHVEAAVYRDLATFTAALRLNIDALAAFYKQHHLECDAKV